MQHSDEAREQARESVRRAVHRLGRVKARLKRRVGLLSELVVLPYRGYSNGRRIWSMGRVLEWGALEPPQVNDSRLKNLVRSLRMLESDEIPDVAVRARIDHVERQLRTDDEGYFTWEGELAEPFATSPGERDDGKWESPNWKCIDFELIDSIAKDQAPARADGHVFVPDASTRFLVISDLDDTVISSRAYSTWQLARFTLFGNALTRLPLPGTAAWYRALVDGKSGSERNGVFYVSRSAWNFYEMFMHFLEHRGLPAGPIILRDLGARRARGAVGHEHKRNHVRRILDMYPRLQAVLVGDSGQRDPELYAEIAEQYPGRIAAIYIHSVSPGKREARATRWAERVRHLGVPMRVVSDSFEAAEHSASLGLMDPARLEDVRRDARADMT